MTKQLEPGPELDALVEEHVFDVKWVRYNRVRINGVLHETETWLLAGENPEFPSSGTMIGQCPPKRSTRISSAWSVVEKTSGDIHSWMIHNQQLGLWFAQRYVGVVGEGRATASTAPHAICLAALEAVGYLN